MEPADTSNNYHHDYDSEENFSDIDDVLSVGHESRSISESNSDSSDEVIVPELNDPQQTRP